MRAGPLLFAPGATRPFGERMAATLGIELAPLEEREYEGGEHKSRPLVSVRGRAVYVVQSLSGDAVRQRQRPAVPAAVPDRGSQGRRGRARHGLPAVPCVCTQGPPHQGTRSRQFALRRAAVRGRRRRPRRGMDVHNIAAFENSFRCSVDLLEAAPLLAEHIVRAADGRPIAIVSPDFGGAKRAQRVQELVAVRTDADVGFAVFEKRRSGGVVSGESAGRSRRGPPRRPGR